MKQDTINKVKKIYKVILKRIPIFILLLSPQTNSEIYSWKDENGKTHFSDKARKGRKSEQINLQIQESSWEKYIIEIIDIDNVLTKEETTQIQIDVNNIYQFFDKKLHFDIYKTVPVKIRLYKKKEDYLTYLSKKTNSNHKNSRGVYFRKTNEIILYLNPEERWRTLWTIKHETSHAIVDTLTPFVPAWLNEGLAENMECLSIDNNNFRLTPHNENHRNAQASNNKGKTLNVKMFLSLSSNDYYESMRQGKSPNQTYAGELTRMLLSTRTGKNFVSRLIHIYERGSRKYSSHLVKKHYIGGLSVLQNNWNTWIDRTNSQNINL